jgi:hypothetical protein
MTWKPWHFLIAAISGWMDREQQQVIDYLSEENRIVRGKLRRKRIILNEPEKQQQNHADVRTSRRRGASLAGQAGDRCSTEGNAR